MKVVGVAADAAKSIATAQLVCVALLMGERLDVTWLLQSARAIVAAHVASDLGRAIEDSDGALRGDERERFAHERVRDRVVVEIEAHVRRLARARQTRTASHSKGVLGQREQALALLAEGVVDRSFVGIAGNRSRVCDAVDPVGEVACSDPRPNEIGEPRKTSGADTESAARPCPFHCLDTARTAAASSGSAPKVRAGVGETECGHRTVRGPRS